METIGDQQTGTESNTRLMAQVKACLRSGDYSRALDLLRDIAGEFPGDADLSELEKRAQDGFKRKSEADRLITQSQELFAQRKSAEAIQLLREAYELDQSNSLARAILANALVEHAQSVVETDWLQAETLANQALRLNPAHPTAKTIQNLIVEQKQNSSVEDWVSRAHKLQSSGDLFAALAWVAEGLAVHPDDAKLLQIQDAIQRDQSARRRQARRTDLDDLRRLQREIGAAKDVAAKQALAERIQGVAAKYWTDGEILSIANALLLRLGLVPQASSTASAQTKNAAVIFHVPRPNVSEPARIEPVKAAANSDSPGPVLPRQAPPNIVAPEKAPAGAVLTNKVLVKVEPPGKMPAAAAEPPIAPAETAVVPLPEPAGKPARVTSARSRQKPRQQSNSTVLVLSSSIAALILLAAILFFTREHHASPAAETPSPSLARPEPAAAASTVAVPSAPGPAPSVLAETTTESSPPTADVSSGTATEAPVDDVSSTQPGQATGALVVVAGQDDVKVLLNGKLQRQLTQAGQLRLPNLAPRNYVVQVAKSGFQDPPAQKIRIRGREEARLTFNLEPKPLLASISIQGGAPGTAVLVDQTPVGTVRPDGTLSVSTVSPGDHTVELRKDRFQPRQFRKHFVVGGTISLAAADASLEPAAAELKINFSPANANVAIAKGDLLKIVSSGVPLNLGAGTYTLTARTAERFTRSATVEVVAGQSKTLDLILAPSGMSRWDDPGAWKQENNAFVRKGGDFVLFGVAPTSGTFVFSAMAKGRLLQWVLNYTDPKNYILFQADDKNFYRSVIRNGQKADEIIAPHKGDKKSFRTFQIHVSRAEIVHEIKDGERWTVLDRWTQDGTNLGQGKFGFYIPGNEQVELSSFAHYADLNVH